MKNTKARMSERFAHVRTNLPQQLARHGEISVFVLLAVMAIASARLSPQFFTPSNLSNVFRQASALGLASIGQTFVVLGRGIDLSLGSIVSLSNCVCAGVMRGNPDRVIPAVVLALGLSVFAGLVNGLLVTKLNMLEFLVTLGSASILSGINLTYSGGREIGSVTTQFRLLSEGTILGVPTSLVVWAVMVIPSMLFLKYRRQGQHIYAIGGDAEVARLSGINVHRIKILTYMLSGLCAGVAGLILAARLRVGFPLAGSELQLDSLAATVMGGTMLSGGRGGLAGTVAGVLVISLLNNIFNLMGISGFAQQVMKGLAIIAIVVIRERR